MSANKEQRLLPSSFIFRYLPIREKTNLKACLEDMPYLLSLSV